MTTDEETIQFHFLISGSSVKATELFTGLKKLLDQ